MPHSPQTLEAWLECLTLPDYLAMTPSGHIQPIVGSEIWIDGNGSHYSRESYIAKYGVDPELGWQAVKEYRKLAGKKDKTMML